MSSVDDRVVKLSFDNTGFEAGATKAIGLLDKLGQALKLDGAAKGLSNVKDSLHNFNMDDVSNSVEECSSRFGAFEAFVAGIFLNLGNRAANFGIAMAKNLTVKPLMDGFGEYETQMRSVQTILSNAGDKLKAQGFTTQEQQIGKINETLDELNRYADKTIYNFSEMTRNIGTFTAAGVDLDTATKSIQGIANLAAASGSSSQQASTAMYQLSQAISSGTVKLQDWNSVVNAGMGGELFQNALKRTARAHGIAVDEMIEKNGSFRESLQEGWITSDILTETLNQLTMSYDKVGDEAYKTNFEILRNQGYSEEDAKAILELAKNAENAATKVRTWTQLWDTVGEALGSGWATTWRTIVGDFLEATDLFTHLSEGITGVISRSADARNAVLADWAGAGGRTALVDGIKYIFDAILSVVNTIGDAFGDVFGVSAEQLYNLTTAFSEFAEKLVPSKDAIQFLYDALYNVFTVIHNVLGIFGNFVRIVARVAGVVWKLVSPFVKLALVIGGGILGAIARFSSYLLKLTDYFEEFVGYITDHFGSAIDIVYGAIGKVIDVFGGLFGIIENVIGVIPSLIGAFGDFIMQSEPVSKVVDAFKGFGDFISGKFLGAVDSLTGGFDKTNKASRKTYKRLEEMSQIEKLQYFFEGLTSKVSNFADEFMKSGDKVAFLKEAFSGPLSTIQEKFSEFYEFVSSKKEKFLKTIDEIKSKSEVLKLVSKPFKDLIDYFKRLSKSGKSIPSMISTIFTDLYNSVKTSVKNLPSLLSTLWEAIKKDFGSFKTFLGTVKDSFVETFRNITSNLPSPQEAGKAIGDFVKSIGDMISNAMSSLTGIGSNVDVSGMFGFLPKIFGDISGFVSGLKESIPVDSIKSSLSEFINSVLDGLSGAIDSIDTDKIKEILDKIIGKIAKIIGNKPWAIALLSIADFLRSLSVLNRGIGKLGKGFGKNFRKFGESIGDGLENFGSGFTKFKKQTKAQAFMRIAAGMLLLAAALWVLAQIPSDRLMQVAGVLAVLGLGITVFMTAAAGLAKLAGLDLEGVGKGIAGFGIGVLALAAAMWILSKIPAEDVDENMNRVLKIIGVLSLAMIAIEAAGGNIKGAAATVLAMAFAVTLLMIPIEILGRTDPNVLHQGGNAVGMILGVLTVAIGIMELCNVHKASIVGSSLALIALAISTTLMIIPIQILGRTNPGILKRGGNAVAQIAGVLSGAIALIGFVGKHAMSILAATPAMLALALSITLLIIPINLLGKMNPSELKQGGVAVGAMGILLAGAIALIGAVAASSFAILAAVPAVLALTICIGALALVVVGLAYIADMHPEGMQTALVAVVAIVMSIAALGAVGTVSGGGLLLLAAGVAAFGAALWVLSKGIQSLQTNVNWEAIKTAFMNTVNAVKNWGKSISTTVSNSFKNFGGDVKRKISSAMSGISSAITSKAGAAKSAMNSLLNGVKSSMNTLGSSLKSKAVSAINGFNSGLRAGISSARSAMSSLRGAVVGAVSGAGSWLVGVGRSVVSGLASGINSMMGAARAAASRIASAVTGASKATLKINSPSKVFRAIGLGVGEGFIQGIDRSVSPTVKSAKNLANKIPDAFSDTLKSLSINMDDLLETDYNPVITPVIDPTQFDSDMSSLTTMLNNRMPDNFNVGSVNYSQQFAAKLADYADVNKQAMEAFANNAIDYDQLGVSVANALIRSGVHVEMDGGQLMGYLAGEIRDARRMYG